MTDKILKLFYKEFGDSMLEQGLNPEAVVGFIESHFIEKTKIEDWQKEGFCMKCSRYFVDITEHKHDCPNCERLLPGGYIKVNDIKDPHCSDCGKKIERA